MTPAERPATEALTLCLEFISREPSIRCVRRTGHPGAHESLVYDAEVADVSAEAASLRAQLAEANAAGKRADKAAEVWSSEAGKAQADLARVTAEKVALSGELDDLAMAIGYAQMPEGQGGIERASNLAKCVTDRISASDAEVEQAQASRDAIAQERDLAIEGMRTAARLKLDAQAERDRLKAALVLQHAMLEALVDEVTGLHEDGCPQDDTCGCAVIAQYNAAHEAGRAALTPSPAEAKVPCGLCIHGAHLGPCREANRVDCDCRYFTFRGPRTGSATEVDASPAEAAKAEPLCAKCQHPRSDHRDPLPAACTNGQTDPLADGPGDPGYGCDCIGWRPPPCPRCSVSGAPCACLRCEHCKRPIADRARYATTFEAPGPSPADFCFAEVTGKPCAGASR